MWWSIVLFGVAAAAPRQSGYALPGATRIEAGGELGLAVTPMVGCFEGCDLRGPQVGLHGAATLSDRTILQFGAGWLELGGVYLGARTNVVDTEQTRLAVWAVGLAGGYFSEGPFSPVGNELGAIVTAGIAGELGTRTIFDFSVAPAALFIHDERLNASYYRGTQAWFMAVPPELGVSFLGPGGHGRARVGFPELLSYRWEQDGWWVKGAVGSVVLLSGLHLEGGLRW